MTEPEVKAAFAAFDPTHPFYRAVLQLMDDAIVTEQDNVTIPHITDGGRHFNAGRLAQAKDFRGVFLGVHQQALVEQAREQRKAELATARAA